MEKRNYIFVGGLFEDSNFESYKKATINTTNFAAYNYFQRLIEHCKTIGNVFVASSPYLGVFNKETKLKNNDIFNDTDTYYYSKNSTKRFSRIFFLKKSLIKAYTKFAKVIIASLKTIIFVTQPNVSYLQAALHIKRNIPNSKIVCVVPDLTLYSNLSNSSFIIKQLKKAENFIFNRYLKKINAYIYFTESMKEVLGGDEKPYVVLETILPKNIPEIRYIDKESRSIVYSGTLNSVFGIKEFVDLFDNYSKTNSINYSLLIAGSGDCLEYINGLNNKNIVYLGSLSPEESANIQRNATIVINPRKNIGEYTKYSFPSKTTEYLLNNGILVGFNLSGIPSEYFEVIRGIKTNRMEDLFNECNYLLNLSDLELNEIKRKTHAFLENKKTSFYSKFDGFIERI